MRRSDLRQAAQFVAVSGAGWLLDVAVFMALSGPAGWHVLPANVVSGSCGVLLVFAVSSRKIFTRNTGSMAQKVAMLLLFNLVAIITASFVLAWIAQLVSAAAAPYGLPPYGVRLVAKMLVTPVTLLLNFIVVRYLVERFVGLSGPALQRAPQ